jgi:hypothetical protein
LQNTIATLSDERYTITAAIDFLFNRRLTQQSGRTAAGATALH